MTSMTIEQWLNQHGLLLCAFQWQDLPESLTSATYETLPDDAASQLTPHTLLMLLANAGPSFWRALQGSSIKTAQDPDDEFSVSIAKTFQAKFLESDQFTQLYPTTAKRSHIPLMRLGGLAGWNIPSPLGLGLHPTFGPWSAYRVAWLTQSTQLPSDYVIQPEHYKHIDLSALHNAAELCVGCAAPCTTACPAHAVKLGEPFNSDACYQHRKPTQSECHVHCAARRACPIGQEHQYDNDQLAHHMGMRWRNTQN